MQDSATRSVRHQWFSVISILLSLALAACQYAAPAARMNVPTLAAAEAHAQSDPRYAGIVVDTASGSVLYAEDADSVRHPASLAKMMTLYVLFDALRAGSLAMNSTISISAHAARQPASKLGLRPGETVTVRDAILAICVRSANDVAAAIGESLAGSEPAFAARMTEKARALGMTSTLFTNATGLPDPKMVTTARDMAILARALQTDFPERYGYFSTRAFTWKGRSLQSTNQLLGALPGVDGMKTGYIRASGYNLVASAKRGGKRIIVVVMGEKTGSARNGHVAALIEAYLPAGGGLFALR
jgi:D-alanyl-D-alanine carboxypeptidase